MNGDRWRTIYSNRAGWSPSLPLPAPPANFHVAQTERLHRRLVDSQSGFGMERFAVALETVPESATVAESETVPETETVPDAATEEQSSADATSASDAATDVELPPVISPPERDLRAEVAELLTAPMEYLFGLVVRLAPADDGVERGPFDTSRPEPLAPTTEERQFEERRTALLTELRAWSESLTQFLQDHRAWTVTSLTAAHEKAAATCREQDALVASLKLRYDELGARLRTLQGETSKVRALANSVEEAKPDLVRWPTKEQVAEWEGKRDRVQQALTAARAAEDAVRGERNDLAREIDRAQTELRKRSGIEENLRNRLSGRPFVDPHVGLPRGRQKFDARARAVPRRCGLHVGPPDFFPRSAGSDGCGRGCRGHFPAAPQLRNSESDGGHHEAESQESQNAGCGKLSQPEAIAG